VAVNTTVFNGFPGYGRVFPHPYGSDKGKYFTTLLTLSPAGDDLTLDFAKTLIAAEQLGQDEVTDYLSVSFSSTDYVGHLFGPPTLAAIAGAKPPSGSRGAPLAEVLLGFAR
jgi:hypothetical protein